MARTTRRAFTLVLALMMIFSISVTAFADTTDAKISYYINGEAYYDFDTTSGISVMDALLSDPDAEAEFGPEFMDKYNKPAHVLLTMMGASSDPVNGADYGVEAEAWSTANAGYGLVSVDKDADGNITAYNYVYTGYDWMYSVTDANGNSVDVDELYMNQYTIQPGDVVIVDYAFRDVYWTQTTPWSAAYPYI